MIKIFKCDGIWCLIDEHQSAWPIRQYEDIKELLEDLEFLLEGYNKEGFKNDL